jgi:RPA family protein
MEEQNKRKSAVKIQVHDILSATYIKRPGWEPSGILTKYGEITRVHLIGLVVSLNENSKSSFLLDDGTGNIEVRSFESNLAFDFALGDMIQVIGKPREWENSKYIVPEIVKKITDRKWYDVYQLELKLQKLTKTIKLPVSVQEQETDPDMEHGPYQKILNVIAILDKGDGADIDEIVSNVKVDGCESIVKGLIEEGEIYEISPGKVKLLE